MAPGKDRGHRDGGGLPAFHRKAGILHICFANMRTPPWPAAIPPHKCRGARIAPVSHSRLKIPPSRTLLAARIYLLVSRGSTLRRGVVAPSSRGHSR